MDDFIPPVLDPRELNKLAEFAEMGGLGTAHAYVQPVSCLQFAPYCGQYSLSRAILAQICGLHANCASLVDVVAEQADQLMFLTHDRLVILRDMGDVLVASCEGVVGWVRREDVRIDKVLGLGSPTSSVRNVPRPLPSDSEMEGSGNDRTSAEHGAEDGADSLSAPKAIAQGWKTVIVSPSPPAHTALLPDSDDHLSEPIELSGPSGAPTVRQSGAWSKTQEMGDSGLLSSNHGHFHTSPSSGSDRSTSQPGTIDLQRISNQFDLDSPLHTPGSSGFRSDRDTGEATGTASRMSSSAGERNPAEGDEWKRADGTMESFREEENAEREHEEGLSSKTKVRESMASIQSDTSSALGGIGGLLMGGGGGMGTESDLAGERIRLMGGESCCHLLYLSMMKPRTARC